MVKRQTGVEGPGFFPLIIEISFFVGLTWSFMFK